MVNLGIIREVFKSRNGTNIIYVKSNKCLAENNLATGTAQGVVIEPH